MSAPAPAPPPQPPPVIPSDVLDPPAQRQWAFAAILMVQAVKLHDVLFSSRPILLLQWAALDALWICSIPYLRIPRLTWRWSSRICLAFAFWLANWVLFGSYTIARPTSLSLSSLGESIFGGGPDISTDERHIWGQRVAETRGRLSGQHTVKISPISTAYLNPAHIPYCLDKTRTEVLIPIQLNNSHPTSIIYSLSPLGSKSPRRNTTLSHKEIQKLDTEWKSYYDQHRPHGNAGSSDDDDPYDYEYENDNFDSIDPQLLGERKGFRAILPGSHDAQAPLVTMSPREQHFYSTTLQPSQSLTHIRINKPGVIRLEHVSAGSTDFRIYPSEVIVVTCPTARFETPDRARSPNKKECIGTSKELSIVAEGVAPLKLRWHKEVNGHRESFVAEGIEGVYEATHLPLAQNITIPVPLSFSSVGRYRYVVDSLEDGAGNTLDLNRRPASEATVRHVEVVRRSTAAFKNCGAARNIELRKGATAQLALSLGGGQSSDSAQSVKLQYVPAIGISASPWEKDFYPSKDGDSTLPVPVKDPGVYTILGVEGQECIGDVLSPEVCKVVELSLPSAKVSLESIHECSGDVGVRASIVLHGSPPFTIHYTEQRNRDRPKTVSKAIDSARGEIVLQPESSGSYTYTFTHVSDRNYRDIPLTGDNLSITQNVHPLAAADFVRRVPSSTRGDRLSLSSCSGKTIDVDVDLRGTAPWTVELQIAAPHKTEVIPFSGLTKSRSRLTVKIPEEVDVEGGTFQVDLVSVVDANGCKRSLSVPGISTTVQRVLPTVKFYSNDAERRVIVLEDEIVSLPLRLTGEGPWVVDYRHEESGITRQRTVRSANDELRVQEEGTYELIGVKDAHCPGSVVPTEGTYRIEWLPRPRIAFDADVGKINNNDVIIREPVCEGAEDFADLVLEGRPPFQIAYVHKDHEHKHDENLAFNSVQKKARLVLKTSSAGRHTYDLTDVGDASYPIKDEVNPPRRPQRGRYLQQEVMARPTAAFKTLERLAYCLGDALVPRSEETTAGLVVLHGAPPFDLTLSVRNYATNEIRKTLVTVNAHEWRLNLPDYKFETIGPTLVTIESFKDSSPCPEAEPETSRRSIWADVAETAAVVPFDRKKDYCIGEPISLQLEGIPPWTVKYSFLGKTIETTSAVSKFTRVPAQPGVFKVLSIAHQRNMCTASVEGIEMIAHDIPSARVSHGSAQQDTIQEGDQATITFELLGEPPFTFTYQRTAITRSKGKPPQVLETHTVSGVQNKTYSISSSAEGTWTVTFIADKYCRYPANPPDVEIESA